MKKNMSEKKNNTKKRVLIVVLIIVGLLLIAVVGTGIMFKDELKIVSSISKIKDYPAYYMEVNGDYHFDEFLTGGGASTDSEVSEYLTSKISHGFYKVDVINDGPACSTISAKTTNGNHIWGRNFDWGKTVPIIVKSTPSDGYASISTCEFGNITGSASVLPEGIANKMLAIAALYVPMDGINEKGLCIAELEVNEGGMPNLNTDKPDLTITTAIRLALNKAATVEDAIALFEQYDIHASANISHHFSVSDATGKAVSVEFGEDGIIVVDTNTVTNFNLANGDIAAGGESPKRRYETLNKIYDDNKGILNRDIVKDALSQVSQPTGDWTTQWSIIYEQDNQVDYYFNSDFSKEPLSYSIKEPQEGL